MRAFGNQNSSPLFQNFLKWWMPVLVLICLFSRPCFAEQADENIMTGSQIMAEVFQRHKLFPYVYEEQTLVLTDRAGHRDVRKVRRFSRLEKDGTASGTASGTAKFLLVFDSPAEVQGTALRIIRHGTGQVENQIYLPALGEELSSGQAKDQGRDFLGTDFALEDLMETLETFRYVRMPDQLIAKTPYFVVDAFPVDDNQDGYTGYSMRRFFIRQDIYFVVRTDYYDRGFRFHKQLTLHDLQQVGKKMWRANMLFMDNHRQAHTTLIKIDRRVFSQDYVLPEIFNPACLGENRHINPNVEIDLGEGSIDENQSANKR